MKHSTKVTQAPQPTSDLYLSIAIDGNEANVTNRVGSNVYAFEIITALYYLLREKYPKIKVTVLLTSSPLNDLPSSHEKWQYHIITPQFFWTQWALPLHLFWHRKAYDVLFTPGHYAPRLSQVPYVSSVMDLAFHYFPKQFQQKDVLQLEEWTRYSVKGATKIITISQFTKKDVVKVYGKKPNEIVVAYPGPNRLTTVARKHSQKVLKQFCITQPYFLYVGTLQPRKNVHTLVDAFEKLCQRLETQEDLGRRHTKTSMMPQLVLAGKIGWLAEPLLNRIKISRYVNQIILTDFVSDQDKVALLKNATATLLVGTYEGFGIPPLESLQVGTPTIVSSTSSLPEVVGPAGRLVNPQSSTEIANAMRDVLNLTSRARLAFKKIAKKQVQHFSWEKSAQLILDTLVEVAQTGAR